ncbi:MAG: archaeosortase/exosortase family protein [Cyanobacteriota bacterium]|nr:archaeosortase/exosortase family protein [Cyanobacteriota bacterium]
MTGWRIAVRRWWGLRRLWLLLAGAVAGQNMALLHHSQGIQASATALLVWAGALICLEDRLPLLRPKPARVPMVLGFLLLLWVLGRSAVSSHWDGLVLAMPPIAGAALLLLGVPRRHWHHCRDALLCLLLLPAYGLLMRVLPEEPLSLASAQGAGSLLSSLGVDVIVNHRHVLLPGGGVTVLAACNGLDQIAQLLCVAILFQLAFPLRSWRARLFVLAVTPLLGWWINVARVALLAGFAGAGQGKGSAWFDWFHDQAGSLVFSGAATLLLGLLYLQLIERQLRRREQPCRT